MEEITEESEIDGDVIIKKGRPSKIDNELFKSYILEHSKNFENGMIPLKHPFIKSCSLKFEATECCVFLKIKRLIENNVFKKDDHQTFEDNSPNDSIDKNSSNEFSLSPNKIIKLKREESKRLKPIKEKNNIGKLVTKMPEDWTAYIGVHIYEALRLPCSFSFKKGSIKSDNLETTGNCSECKAIVNIKSENNMEVLKIFYIPGDELIPHYKKKRIRNKEQLRIVPEIQRLTAPTYLNKRAAEEMEDGDFIPPYIPSKGK